jgi:hypothetical protein
MEPKSRTEELQKLLKSNSKIALSLIDVASQILNIDPYFLIEGQDSKEPSDELKKLSYQPTPDEELTQEELFVRKISMGVWSLLGRIVDANAAFDKDDRREGYRKLKAIDIEIAKIMSSTQEYAPNHKDKAKLLEALRGQTYPLSSNVQTAFLEWIDIFSPGLPIEAYVVTWLNEAKIPPVPKLKTEEPVYNADGYSRLEPKFIELEIQ